MSPVKAMRADQRAREPDSRIFARIMFPSAEGGKGSIGMRDIFPGRGSVIEGSGAGAAAAEPLVRIFAERTKQPMRSNEVESADGAGNRVDEPDKGGGGRKVEPLDESGGEEEEEYGEEGCEEGLGDGVRSYH